MESWSLFPVPTLFIDGVRGAVAPASVNLSVAPEVNLAPLLAPEMVFMTRRRMNIYINHKDYYHYYYYYFDYYYHYYYYHQEPGHLRIWAFFPVLGDGRKRGAKVGIPPLAKVAALLHHQRHDHRQCHDHHDHHRQIASPYDTRNMDSLVSHNRPCTIPRGRSGFLLIGDCKNYEAFVVV